MHRPERAADAGRQRDGTWKLVAMQSTVVARDLAPLTTSKRSWPSLIGEYSYSPADTKRYHVFERNSRLYGGNSETAATQLIPLTSHVFFQQGSIHTMIFVSNAAGRTTKVIMLHKYNEVVMYRVG